MFYVTLAVVIKKWYLYDNTQVYERDSVLFQEEGGGVENFPLLHRGRNFLLSVV